MLLVPTLAGVEGLAALDYRDAHGVGIELASPPAGTVVGQSDA